MADYTLRNTKGSELTFSEVDNNFIASRTTARANCNALLTPPSGVYINQSFSGTPMVSVSSSSNTIKLSPFILAYDLTIDRVACWSTSVNSTDLRFLIYSALSTGYPSSKLYESSTIATATGENGVDDSFTFTANTVYWLGTHTSGSITFRGIPDDGLLPLGIGTGLNTTGIANHIILGSTAIGSAPSTWSFATTQYGVGEPISVGLRAA